MGHCVAGDLFHSLSDTSRGVTQQRYLHLFSAPNIRIHICIWSYTQSGHVLATLKIYMCVYILNMKVLTMYLELIIIVHIVLFLFYDVIFCLYHSQIRLTGSICITSTLF